MESEAAGRVGGAWFFIESPRRGGGLAGDAGCRGARREFGGGGLNIFFGAEIPTKLRINSARGHLLPLALKRCDL